MRRLWLIFGAVSLFAQRAPLFKDEILPIFEKSCTKCHGAQQKMGGLDLSTFTGLMTGGASGPAIAPGGITGRAAAVWVSGMASSGVVRLSLPPWGRRCKRGAGTLPCGATKRRRSPVPAPDLEALWDEHCRHEFETRDVDATMATMVADPYVNHIPTMTGGVGHDLLKRFYKYHFIGGNPPDMALHPVTRTVGADRLVDEMILSFTHTTEIDWILPGVAPAFRCAPAW